MARQEEVARVGYTSFSALESERGVASREMQRRMVRVSWKLRTCIVRVRVRITGMRDNRYLRLIGAA